MPRQILTVLLYEFLMSVIVDSCMVNMSVGMTVVCPEQTSKIFW